MVFKNLIKDFIITMIMKILCKKLKTQDNNLGLFFIQENHQIQNKEKKLLRKSMTYGLTI